MNRVIKIIISCIFISVMFFSCPSPEDSSGIISKWDVSGFAKVTFSTSTKVKMAAFYKPSMEDEGIMPLIPVSNVIPIPVSGENSDFCLNIDLSNISCTLGSYVMLEAWNDTNDDGKLDATEDWSVFAFDINDPVWGSSGLCVFIKMPEWCYNSGVAFVSINSNPIEGAFIQATLP